MLFLACCSAPTTSDPQVEPPVSEEAPETPTPHPETVDASTPPDRSDDDEEGYSGACAVQGHGFVAPPVDIKEVSFTIRYEACVLLTDTPPVWMAEVVTAWENDAGEALCGEIYRGVLIRHDPYTGTHVGGRFMWALYDYRPCESIGLPRLGTQPLANWSFDLLGYVLWVAELPDVPYIVWTPDDRAVTATDDGLHILATDR